MKRKWNKGEFIVTKLKLEINTDLRLKLACKNKSKQEVIVGLINKFIKDANK